MPSKILKNKLKNPMWGGANMHEPNARKNLETLIKSRVFSISR